MSRERSFAVVVQFDEGGLAWRLDAAELRAVDQTLSVVLGLA